MSGNRETAVPLQVATDRETGQWFRCELSDGRVVYINGSGAFPWVDLAPNFGPLAWEPVEDGER